VLLVQQGPTKDVAEKRAMLANLYGIAMPARMDIESQILSRCVSLLLPALIKIGGRRRSRQLSPDLKNVTTLKM
jgi:hypothetical protein